MKFERAGNLDRESEFWFLTCQIPHNLRVFIGNLSRPGIQARNGELAIVPMAYINILCSMVRKIYL